MKKNGLLKIAKKFLNKYKKKNYLSRSIELFTTTSVVRIGKKEKKSLHGANLKFIVTELNKEGEYKYEKKKETSLKDKKYGESITLKVDEIHI